MDETSTRRGFLTAVVGLSVSTSGCGTILYPERRGQPAGRLDWEIVALDAIGLLLFFVPGVIAFAVDFSNGTIYLPPGEYGHSVQPAARGRLHAVSLPSNKPSIHEVEETILRERNVTVALRDEAVKTQSIDSVDEFWPAVRQLSGHSTEV